MPPSLHIVVAVLQLTISIIHRCFDIATIFLFFLLSFFYFLRYNIHRKGGNAMTDIGKRIKLLREERDLTMDMFVADMPKAVDGTDL